MCILCVITKHLRRTANFATFEIGCSGIQFGHSTLLALLLLSKVQDLCFVSGGSKPLLALLLLSKVQDLCFVSGGSKP
jgi:hypothetical protein